jgi:lysozyme
MNWEQRLEFHEGFSSVPYYCTEHKLSIGIGHNTEARPFTDEEKKAIGDWKKGITKNMAYMILRNDMEICLKDLRKLGFWYYLDNERRYALLDMCFQLGFEGLCKFKKMLEAIRVKDYSEASRQCLDSDYHRQTPKRCERIAKLIRTGVWEI